MGFRIPDYWRPIERCCTCCGRQFTFAAPNQPRGQFVEPQKCPLCRTKDQAADVARKLDRHAHTLRCQA